MKQQTSGIHHVTAIASDPQRNLDFYAAVLGLRLVKLTVNFDDPGTYHFYFADALGRPGTVLTFFPWPDARRGHWGNGQAAATSFSIPAGAIGYWRERLQRLGVSVGATRQRFEEEVLAFVDPDGLQLELVAHAEAQRLPSWETGPIPSAYAIRGFHSVTLWEQDVTQTADLLTETLGLRLVAETGRRYRFAAGSDEPGRLVDVMHQPDENLGWGGAGTVHHVAWRTKDDAEQLEWQQRIAAQGLRVSPVMDRQYFHSIYFREPGGVLFEIATDPPGFTLDETPERLGQHLKLPPWLEPRRDEIEESLPAIRMPQQAMA